MDYTMPASFSYVVVDDRGFVEADLSHFFWGQIGHLFFLAMPTLILEWVLLLGARSAIIRHRERESAKKILQGAAWECETLGLRSD